MSETELEERRLGQVRAFSSAGRGAGFFWAMVACFCLATAHVSWEWLILGTVGVYLVAYALVFWVCCFTCGGVR